MSDKLSKSDQDVDFQAQIYNERANLPVPEMYVFQERRVLAH